MKRIFRKELWQKVGRANEDFTLVEEGDHIALGLSGGKDSLTLVYVMSEWQRETVLTALRNSFVWPR